MNKLMLFTLITIFWGIKETYYFYNSGNTVSVPPLQHYYNDDAYPHSLVHDGDENDNNKQIFIKLETDISILDSSKPGDGNQDNNAGDDGDNSSDGESSSSSSSCDSDFDKYGGIIAYIILIFYCFIGLAILCEGEFKDSIVKLSQTLKLSPDVAGATLMAAGTSSPELFTALVAVFGSAQDIGSGTVVGSAVFNVLIIIGSCAIFSSFQFNLDWKPITRDVFVNVVSFVFLYLSFRDEKVTIIEAIVGFGLYVMYVFALAFNDRLMSGMEKAGKLITSKLKCCERFCYESDEPEVSNIDFNTLDDSPYDPLALIPSDDDDDHHLNNDDDEEAARRSPSSSSPSSSPPSSRNHHREKLNIELESLNTLPSQKKSEEKDDDPKREIEVTSASSSSSSSSSDRHDRSGEEGEEEEEDFEEMMKKRRKRRSDDDFEETENSPRHHQTNHHFSFSEFSKMSKKDKAWFILALPFELVFYFTIPRVNGRFKHQYIFSFVMSLFWLGFLSIVMVKSAEKVGCILHIDDAVMGLTALAVGTSIPDCLASVAVAKTGRGNMAVCNALGSNIFDILVALCLPWILSIFLYQNDVEVGSDTLVEDVVLLFAGLGCFYLALIVTKWKLNRRVGYFLVLLYCFFIGYTLLREFGLIKLLIAEIASM